MSELLSQLWTPEMQAAFTVVLVLLVILYVLSIVWVVRDAYLRGTAWYIWAVVSLVPVLGVIAYCLLRPPLLQLDKDEQELEIALKQRQLMKYGECAACGYPRGGRFRALPELPHSAEEPLHALQPRAGALLDGVPLLRHPGGRARSLFRQPSAAQRVFRQPPPLGRRPAVDAPTRRTERSRALHKVFPD